MALVLSQNNGTFVTLRPKSLICCLSHEISAQQLPIAMYSTSAIERATHLLLVVS